MINYFGTPIPDYLSIRRIDFEPQTDWLQYFKEHLWAESQYIHRMELHDAMYEIMIEKKEELTQQGNEVSDIDHNHVFNVAHYVIEVAKRDEHPKLLLKDYVEFIKFRYEEHATVVLGVVYVLLSEESLGKGKLERLREKIRKEYAHRIINDFFECGDNALIRSKEIYENKIKEWERKIKRQSFRVENENNELDTFTHEDEKILNTEINSIFALFVAMYANGKYFSSVMSFVEYASKTFPEFNNNINKSYYNAINDKLRNTNNQYASYIRDQGTMLEFIDSCYKKSKSGKRSKQCENMRKNAEHYYETIKNRTDIQ